VDPRKFYQLFQNLYTEYYYGKQAGSEYVIGTRKAIKNDRPIIGVYNVNHEGSGDMYYKGGNMLHTIRQIIDNDKKWRKLLNGLNKKFYHQTVTTAQIEQYMIKKSRKELSKIFDQYLRDTRIPRFDYSIHSGVMSYRWRNVVAGFNMPVRVRESEQAAWRWLKPTDSWQTTTVRGDSLMVDKNFYVEVRKAD